MGNRGFLLLETFLALLIFSTGVVALLGGFSRLAQRAERHSQYFKGGLVLEARAFSEELDVFKDATWTQSTLDISSQQKILKLSWPFRHRTEEMSLAHSGYRHE